MPTYRAYHIKDDKHFAGPPAIIEAADDAAAIEQARQLVDGHDVELWESARFVIGFKRKHE